MVDIQILCGQTGMTQDVLWMYPDSLANIDQHRHRYHQCHQHHRRVTVISTSVQINNAFDEQRMNLETLFALCFTKRSNLIQSKSLLNCLSLSQYPSSPKCCWWVRNINNLCIRGMMARVIGASIILISCFPVRSFFHFLKGFMMAFRTCTKEIQGHLKLVFADVTNVFQTDLFYSCLFLDILHRK